MSQKSINNYQFAKCFLECSLGSRSETMVATISPTGAQGVDFKSMPYSNIAALAGKIIDVTLAGSIRLKGKVYKECGQSGTSFSIAFLDITPELADQIEKVIAGHHFPTPWNRGESRLSSSSILDDKNFVVPLKAVSRDELRTVELKVLNYSCNGMQLEALGANKASWSLGGSINFDMLLSNKRKIPNLTGVVVRITEDLNLESSESIYRYGIQLTDENMVALRQFNDLVTEAEDIASRIEQAAA